MQDHVGQKVDGNGGVLRGEIDVVDRAIKRRVGVDVTAVRLDGGGDLAAGPAFRSLEEHVLKEVGKPRSQVPAFVNAAGLDPNLNGRQRRGGVALEQQRQAVGQHLTIRWTAPEAFQQA